MPLEKAFLVLYLCGQKIGASWKKDFLGIITEYYLHVLHGASLQVHRNNILSFIVHTKKEPPRYGRLLFV